MSRFIPTVLVPTRMNGMLLGAALALLLYYVMQANLLAAQTWQMRDAQNTFAALMEDRNAIVAQSAELDDRAVLEQLAVREGFVPAGSVVYLMQEGSVATAR